MCVEVPSETEAVQGNPMKLRCISCMKREEVEATTVVEWFYRPEGGKDFLVCLAAVLAFLLLTSAITGLDPESPGMRRSDRSWFFLFKALTAPLQIPDSPASVKGRAPGQLQAFLLTRRGRGRREE